MAHLPSLAGLRLGPPTGPMAQYGKQILEPPSQETDGGKRRKGDDGLAVQVFRWVAEDGDNPICPITQLPFVPGQWVYKTPAEPPANPINYDPYALDQYWASQTPVMGFLHDTNRNLIPISEWNDPVDGLAVWVNNHPKVASPDLSPIRPDQVFHNPIVNGAEFTQKEQPPVDEMEGMLYETTVLGLWAQAPARSTACRRRSSERATRRGSSSITQRPSVRRCATSTPAMATDAELHTPRTP